MCSKKIGKSLCISLKHELLFSLSHMSRRRVHFLKASSWWKWQIPGTQLVFVFASTGYCARPFLWFLNLFFPPFWETPGHDHSELTMESQTRCHIRQTEHQFVQRQKRYKASQCRPRKRTFNETCARIDTLDDLKLSFKEEHFRPNTTSGFSTLYQKYTTKVLRNRTRHWVRREASHKVRVVFGGHNVADP